MATGNMTAKALRRRDSIMYNVVHNALRHRDFVLDDAN